MDVYLLLLFPQVLPKQHGGLLHRNLLLSCKNYARFWTVNSNHVKKLWKKRLRIEYMYESSNHDGYCSGNECEYAIENCTHISTRIPKEYTNYDVGTELKDVPFDYEHLVHLCEPGFPGFGPYYQSGYCELSDECIVRNLDKHDFRVTVTSVQIVFY